MLRTNKTAREALNTCLKRVGITYVILDGVDECQQTEQKHIVQFWLSYASNNGYSCHCALFSQDDENTRPLLAEMPAIQVNGEQHSTDVETFCKLEAEKVGKKFGLSPFETSRIASQVSLRANGMFLYARVVATNLLDQVKRADLFTEMRPDTFPHGFNEA